MADNIRGIINVKTEGGKTLYKVKERSSTESRWIESTSSELSEKHILAFEQKQKERKEAKKAKRSRDDEPGVPKPENDGAAAPATARLPDQGEMKLQIRELLKTRSLDEVTKKDVRRLLEQKLKLPEGALDGSKATINETIEEYMVEQQEQETSADGAAQDSENSGESSAESDSDSDSDEAAKPVKKAKLTVETVSGRLCCLHNIITAAPLTFFKISSLYRRCLPQEHRQAADRYYVKARILESAMLLLCCCCVVAALQPAGEPPHRVSAERGASESQRFRQQALRRGA